MGSEAAQSKAEEQKAGSGGFGGGERKVGDSDRIGGDEVGGRADEDGFGGVGEEFAAEDEVAGILFAGSSGVLISLTGKGKQ